MRPAGTFIKDTQEPARLARRSLQPEELEAQRDAEAEAEVEAEAQAALEESGLVQAVREASDARGGEKPTVKEVSALHGETVSAEDRDAAWEAVLQQDEEGAE